MPPPSKVGFIPPMLPTLVDEPPGGDRWLHEIKYDGYRTQLLISGEQIQTFTRNGHDWTYRYRAVVSAARILNCRSAIIDGEMCVQNELGITDFAALRRSIQSAPGNLVLFAFDLLHLNGRDLRSEPLIERRRRLEDLIGVPDPAYRIHFSPHIAGDGPNVFGATDAAGLEGVVSKRVDSRYLSGRSKAWFKTKSFTVADYSVLGVERSETGVPVAILATLGDGAYVGNATITLTDRERKAFWADVDRMGSPQARLGGLGRRKGATWIKPGLVARVRHLRGEEKLRHATLQKLNPKEPLAEAVIDRHAEGE